VVCIWDTMGHYGRQWEKPARYRLRIGNS